MTTCIARQSARGGENEKRKRMWQRSGVILKAAMAMASAMKNTAAIMATLLMYQ